MTEDVELVSEWVCESGFPFYAPLEKRSLNLGGFSARTSSRGHPQRRSHARGVAESVLMQQPPSE